MLFYRSSIKGPFLFAQIWVLLYEQTCSHLFKMIGDTSLNREIDYILGLCFQMSSPSHWFESSTVHFTRTNNIWVILNSFVLIGKLIVRFFLFLNLIESRLFQFIDSLFLIKKHRYIWKDVVIISAFCLPRQFVRPFSLN